jgi:cytoskeleton protein RodZ
MQDNDVNSADEDGPEEETSTLGRALRAARESQELSLDQVASELRIEPRFLVSLEEDDFEAFSAPVFAKGFLKQYGRRLGLDYGDLLAQYYRQVDIREVPVVRQRPIRLRDEPQITQWIMAGVVLLTLIGGFTVWTLRSPQEVPVAVSPSSPVEVPEDPVALPSEPQAIPLPAPAQPEPLDPLPAAAVPVQPATPSEEPPEAMQPTVQVEIEFQEDCWTEVTDARGERLFYGLGSAGARTRFLASPPLSFFLGNADGVSVSIDGRPFSVPADGRQGNLARFVVLEADP